MILAESISLGLIFSLYLSETIGYVAGGLVVPGYIAVILNKIPLLAGTFAIAFITLGLLKLAARFMLLYGRRRLLLAVIIGFFFSQLSQYLAYTPYVGGVLSDIRAFGFIIPGLMAASLIV
jgi:poly-gamma-glutamate biosynthesis protein PgsC/CapC